MRLGPVFRAMILVVMVAATVMTTRAHAQSTWLNQELDRLAALPHTLQAVRDNAWLGIPGRDRHLHGITDDAYRRDAIPRLDALAAAARPDLERELDGILRALRYEDLRETAARQPLSYCAWIGTTRPDGMLPSASDLQATLSAHCRVTAASSVATLLDRHADAVDLTLPALPVLDLAFPGWLLADLAEPDVAGAIAIDRVTRQAAYRDRVAGRIATATPSLRQAIDRAFDARRWTGGAFASPDADCRAQLGPLAAGDLLAQCKADASRWLTTVGPTLVKAMTDAIAPLPKSDPSLTAADICRSLISRWLPGDAYPEPFRTEVRQACLQEAEHSVTQAAADRARAIAEAITVRAANLAAPILAAPPTYESLLAHAWFSQPPASWDGIVPPSDPEAMAVQERTKAEYARLIGPASEAAVVDAKKRIATAYTEAAGLAAAIPETRHLCGTNGQGAGLPPALAGSPTRDQILTSCKTASDAFKAARAHLALDRAGIQPADTTSLLVTVEGDDARFLLRDLVTRAAAAGLQVRSTAGFLGIGARLLISPMGAETPVLTGTVSREGRGLRLTGLDSFPAWPAGALDTVACVMSSEEELANAQFTAFVTIMGSFFAFDTDRPRTAGVLLREGLVHLQSVQNRRACLEARQAFIDRASGG